MSGSDLFSGRIYLALHPDNLSGRRGQPAEVRDVDLNNGLSNEGSKWRMSKGLRTFRDFLQQVWEDGVNMNNDLLVRTRNKLL